MILLVMYQLVIQDMASTIRGQMMPLWKTLVQRPYAATRATGLPPGGGVHGVAVVDVVLQHPRADVGDLGFHDLVVLKLLWRTLLKLLLLMLLVLPVFLHLTHVTRYV